MVLRAREGNECVMHVALYVMTLRDGIKLLRRRQS